MEKRQQRHATRNVAADRNAIPPRYIQDHHAELRGGLFRDAAKANGRYGIIQS